MKKIYLKVKTIVNNLDPIGLIGCGAPVDEYSSEINKIVSLLQNDTKAESLAEEIYRIFVESFNQETAGEKSKYLKIAEELLK